MSAIPASGYYNSYVYISSNILIAKVITRKIVTTVYSGNINSTVTGIIRRSKSSKKSKPTQFAQV